MSVRVKSVVEKWHCDMFFSEYFGFLRRLVADFSLWRPGFDNMSVHVRSMVDD